jgi:hypothetical protein
VSEKSYDDYLEIDINNMVRDFINIAMERMPFPKKLPDDVPGDLVFLRQPDEKVNSIQYCFM